MRKKTFKGKKESSRPVSRVLYRSEERRLPLISSRRYRRALAIYPLTSGGQPLSPVYMILQPMGRTATPYCYVCGELLPRLFTLTFLPVSRKREGGYSLLRYLNIAAYRYISRHGALCCPDFPPARRRAADRPAAFFGAAKVVKKIKMIINKSYFFSTLAFFLI